MSISMVKGLILLRMR